MSTWCTLSDLKQYLDQITDPLQDPVLQAVLDRAEATIARYLTGVVIEPPAPDDLQQIVLELSSSMYLTKGTASDREVIGVDGQGGFVYVGQLNDRQKGALRQIRIEAGDVAV
jgi:hypothetical protein